MIRHFFLIANLALWNSPALAQIAIEPVQEECGVSLECKPPTEPELVAPDDDPHTADHAKPKPVTSAAGKPAPDMSAAEKSALDLAFWNSIKDSDNPVLFQAYLAQFPDGVFAIIAREKLKKPGASQAAASKPKPAVHALTLKGLGDLAAQTPFTLSAIKKALPGFTVKQFQTYPEGIEQTGYAVAINGTKAFVINGYDGRIIDMRISSPLVSGPFGVHVGDSLSQVMNKVRLSDCVWGEEMGRRVFCSPAVDDDVFDYTFQLKAPLNIKDGVALTPDMIPPAAILDEITWRPRHPETQANIATEPQAMPTPPPVATNAQQLVQQGDRILKKSYQLDVSQWDGEAARALKLYRQAAKLGSAIAWYKIGFLYEIGNGIAKDNNAAIRYYEKAAAKGYHDAFSQIILVQNQFKNYKGAAKTFFRFYRANPALALRDASGSSHGVTRAIQRAIRDAGYYAGPIDGDIGPGTRKAIAAYIDGAPKPTTSKDNNALPALAAKLQRQLQRVGCYNGAIDGQWGSGSARAMRNFNHWAGKNLPINKPTSKALRAVAATKGQICGVD